MRVKPNKHQRLLDKNEKSEGVTIPEKERTPIANTHKVSKRQWVKWNRKAQMVFNSTYSWMRSNQQLMNHPKSELLPKEQWNTVAWNAAWIAADAVMNKYWGYKGDGKEKPEVDIEIIYPASLRKDV